MANCSSVAGMRAFLDEEADHREVEYFQGLEQFREQGLPCQLPAAERDKLQDDSVLGELQQSLRALRLQGAPSSVINEAKSMLRQSRRRAHHSGESRATRRDVLHLRHRPGISGWARRQPGAGDGWHSV